MNYLVQRDNKTMTQDSTQNQSEVLGGKVPTRWVMCLVSLAGLSCITSAVLAPGLEWRLLAVAALAAAVSPFMVEVRARDGTETIRLSLTHSVLFAGVLALGPLYASLPAAFSAAARLIAEAPSYKAPHRILYAIVKPAAVCSGASFVYVTAGGNLFRPQQVDSFVALMLAGIVYVGANVVLLGTTSETQPTNTQNQPLTLGILAGWSLCLFGGYALAVLYAIAPGYVLLALAGPTALAAGSLLTAPKNRSQVCECESEPAASEVDEEDSVSIFTDPVTGLANRRYLEMFLNNELSRSQRAERPLSVAVFDLDEFKNAPEEYNEAAQQALVTMGETLKLAVREYDLVAAYSPTRIIAVLPETTAPEAEEIARRLHESVTIAQLNGKTIPASVGISTFPDHGSTVDDLINASHRALNQGRFLGPNRVHSCCEIPKAS